MTEYNFARQGWRDPVYLIAITASTAAFLLAISLIVLRPILLSQWLIPFVKAYYSSDGELTQEGVAQLRALLTSMAFLTVVLGCLAFGYACLWRYFSARLPAGGPGATQPLFIASGSVVEMGCLLTTLALALILRLHSLTRGLTFDEIVSAVHFVEVDSVWKTLSSYLSFANHIAYSLLARWSQAIFGHSEWAFRLPALLLGLGSLYLFWLFVRHMLGAKIALIATFALAISPMHVSWSVLGRGYAGMIFFTLLATYMYLRLLGRPSYRDCLVFIMASVIGIYFHLYAAFVTIVQSLFLLLSARRPSRDQGIPIPPHRLLYKESFQLLWIALAVIVLLSLSCYAPVMPELVFNIVTKGPGAFQPLFPFTVMHAFAGSSWGLLTTAFSLVFVLGLITLWQSHRQKAIYFTWLLLLPLGIVWLAHPRYLFPRFFAYFLPYYVLLLSLGFVTLWHVALRRSLKVYQYISYILCLMLVGSVLYIWTKSSWYDREHHGFREAARAMAVETGPESALCAIGPGADLFQYYSKKKILLPADMRQFAHILENYAAVQCAYFEPFPPGEFQRDIRDFLAQNAIVQRHAWSTVFTYRPNQAKHRKRSRGKLIENQ